MKRFLVWLGLAEPEPVLGVVSVELVPEMDGFVRAVEYATCQMRGLARVWAFEEAVAAFDRPVSTEVVLARYLDRVVS